MLEELLLNVNNHSITLWSHWLFLPGWIWLFSPSKLFHFEGKTIHSHCNRFSPEETLIKQHNQIKNKPVLWLKYKKWKTQTHKRQPLQVNMKWGQIKPWTKPAHFQGLTHLLQSHFCSWLERVWKVSWVQHLSAWTLPRFFKAKRKWQ